jgi:UDP-N-acetylglucosamine 2-epimerase (non-hydrolysing)
LANDPKGPGGRKPALLDDLEAAAHGATARHTRDALRAGAARSSDDDNGVRVLAVVGTRPEAIKMFSPVRALRERSELFETYLCSTGQHSVLLTDALATFELVPDFDFSAMRRNQQPADVAWTIGRWMTGLCRRLEPDLVLVQGDTTTTLIAGLAAFYAGIPLAHIEAGLRTYDNYAPWPEEAHRRMLGAFADLHFAPSPLAAANLVREGVDKSLVHVSGNTGIDALHWAVGRPRNTPHPSAAERRVVITTHRRESIPWGVEAVATAVLDLAVRYPDVRFQFVMHPNPEVERIARAALFGSPVRNLEIVPPIDYVSFVHMLADSSFVITDSGGLQEEAPSLGKPVLVVNERTARREPVEAGTSLVVGTERHEIVRAAARLLDDAELYRRMAVAHEPYGDGLAGERIVDVLAATFEAQQETVVAAG